MRSILSFIALAAIAFVTCSTACPRHEPVSQHLTEAAPPPAPTQELTKATPSTNPNTTPAGPELKIADLHNVRHLTDKLYCGSVPDNDAAFKALAGLGIKTVLSVDGSKPHAANVAADAVQNYCTSCHSRYRDPARHMGHPCRRQHDHDL